MYKVPGNKIVRVGNKVPVAENRSIIEFTVRGTSFPDRDAATQFSLVSNVSQNMYADFNDGTGIHTYALAASTNAWGSYSDVSRKVMWYFQDLADPSKIGTIDSTYPQQRIIRIWFDYPSKIKNISGQNFNLYGDFPKNIKNYNLDTLTLSGMNYINSFPTDFRGGVYGFLNFNNISQMKPSVLPEWLQKSKINTLILNSIFNFSGSYTTTGINNISLIQGLKTLFLPGNQMGNNSFPTTLKDITTLEGLYVGSNLFTTFPSAIGECAQLKTLTLSNSDGYGYNTTMTSWGSGIGLMTSLQILFYANTSNNFPTTVPTGAETAVMLKTVNVKSSFATSQARTDAFVNNWYDFIVANASLISGNTKFRQMVFDIGNSITTTLRPSGGATPTVLVDPPTTPIQKIYYMVKKYGHVWTIRNLANTGTELIMP